MSFSQNQNHSPNKSNFGNIIGTGYFKTVPFFCLLILGWFFSEVFSQIFKIISSLPLVIFYRYRETFPSIGISNLIISILALFFSFAILGLNLSIIWGIYKQKFWIKKIAIIWYTVKIATIGLSVYSSVKLYLNTAANFLPKTLKFNLWITFFYN